MVKYIAVGLMSLTVSACQLPEPPSEKMSAFETRMERAAEKIQHAQDELFQAGVLNKRREEPPVLFVSDRFQPISISWDGDAKILLKKMAKDSGRTFDIVGVEMPLPVSVHKDDVSFHDVIYRLQSQIGYRAVVAYTNDAVTLHYHKPSA